jgi:hypothetical protein
MMSKHFELIEVSFHGHKASFHGHKTSFHAHKASFHTRRPFTSVIIAYSCFFVAEQGGPDGGIKGGKSSRPSSAKKTHNFRLTYKHKTHTTTIHTQKY